jgi:hypothetical protein
MNPFSTDYNKLPSFGFTPKKTFPPANQRMSVAPKMSVASKEDLAASQRNVAPTTQGGTAPKSTSIPTKTTQPKPKKSAEETYQEQVRKAIEDASKQQLQFLGQREASLQAELPTVLEQVASPFEQQLPALQQQLQQQQTLGAEQTESLKQQEQQALAQARRSAEEQGLRAVQQFGGVGGSSTAQAAGELIGREALRTQGAIQTQRAAGIQNIQNQLRAIQGEYDANAARLQLQKQQAVSQARLDFQRQLDSIKQARAEVGVTKANQTLQALSDFAARRRQLEDQSAQQQNNLNLLREQAILNAQNVALTQNVTPQQITPVNFAGFVNASERAKALQSIISLSNNDPNILASYGIRYAGKNPDGNADLYAFTTSQGFGIVDQFGRVLN